ncbi:hypothetical protein SAMN05216436_101140 [bacterium A37T11]|nr:hypothetical protein SAMN05216436_101140 [bacterium A37T11]
MNTIQKSIFKLTILSSLVVCGQAQAQAKRTSILPATLQIKIAEQAAPPDQRAGAKVYGYSPQGDFTVLRVGSNHTICLAPNPKQAGLFAYAYFDQLEPFMARGRELVAEGKKYQEKNDIREAEVKSGKLKMPKQASILYVYWGEEENLDRETGEIKDALRRYVVYIPYATGASTGLSETPSVPGLPWLMEAGTYKAHIMMNPENLSMDHGQH